MIAVDTNILIYAHREDAEWHAVAYARVAQLAENRSAWAIPWPCVHEFIAIATHPRIFSPPTPLVAALDQFEAWLESPSLVVLAESQLHWQQLRGLLLNGKIAGPMVHDARVRRRPHGAGFRQGGSSRTAAGERASAARCDRGRSSRASRFPCRLR